MAKVAARRVPLFAAFALLVGGLGAAVYLSTRSSRQPGFFGPGALAEPSPSTVVASPTPGPTEWITYTQPASVQSDSFSFQYPPTWFLQGGDVNPDAAGITIYLTSWDPATWSDPVHAPANAVKVGIGVDPSRIPCEPSGATPATVGGVPGRQAVNNYNPPDPAGFTRAHEVQVTRRGFTYCIGALFAQEMPDEATFARILASFTFEG